TEVVTCPVNVRSASESGHRGRRPACSLRANRRHRKLFDHLVSLREQRRWRLKVERLGGLEVDNQIVLRRCLHREIARLLALQKAVSIDRGSPILVRWIRPVTEQASRRRDEVAAWIDRRQSVPGRKTGDEIPVQRARR